MFNMTCSNFTCTCKTIFTHNYKMVCILCFKWSIIIKYMKLNLGMYIYAKDIKGLRKGNDYFWLANHGDWPRFCPLSYLFFHVNWWRWRKFNIVLTYCGSFNTFLSNNKCILKRFFFLTIQSFFSQFFVIWKKIQI